jgi:hypothetical protein
MIEINKEPKSREHVFKVMRRVDKGQFVSEKEEFLLQVTKKVDEG